MPGLIIGIINVVINTEILKIVPQNLMARIQCAFSTFTLAATFVAGMAWRPANPVYLFYRGVYGYRAVTTDTLTDVDHV